MRIRTSRVLFNFQVFVAPQVPLLKSKDTQAEALAEARAQLRREAEAAEQVANASATATAPGVVDMPAALTKVELPSVDPAEISSFKESAKSESAMSDGGNNGEQKQETQHLARSWLPLFSGMGNGNDGGAEEQQEESSLKGSAKPEGGKNEVEGQGRPHLARSWLRLFNGKENGKEGSTEKQQKAVESNGRSWPLPLLFWKQ